MLNNILFESETPTNEYIVLLHGFGGNHRVWKHQIPILQKYYNVIAIDLPSHNVNNIKLSKMEVTIDAVSREILKVLDFYKVKKAVFMGVSLGTIFIKHIEMKYPQYVESGILVGTVGKLGFLLGMTAKIFSQIGDRLPFRLVYRIFSKIMMPMRSSEKSRSIFCKCAEDLNAREFKKWMDIFVESISMNIKFRKCRFLNNFYLSGDTDVCFLKAVKKEVKATKAKFIQMHSCGHVCNIDQKEKFNRLIVNHILKLKSHNI